jgi:hypothetical protein
MICHEMPKHFDAKAFQKSRAVQVFTFFDLFDGRVVPRVPGGTYRDHLKQKNSYFNTGINTV